ncbi:hypothetical protein BDV96DRAFT_643584 [Lophiotrema nucula]|uniref:Uncharacterized protein n=1 Tax=Lophiotrema nucula TaxID=690887 RepID=A0A6A5ZJ49_9PLEO|nr:hypothetical protein BDV96DRAFT_643584 [Lophiotrema nucula]
MGVFYPRGPPIACVNPFLCPLTANILNPILRLLDIYIIPADNRSMGFTLSFILFVLDYGLMYLLGASGTIAIRWLSRRSWMRRFVSRLYPPHLRPFARRVEEEKRAAVAVQRDVEPGVGVPGKQHHWSSGIGYGRKKGQLGSIDDVCATVM